MSCELQHFDLSPLCEGYNDSCPPLTLKAYLDEFFGVKTLLLELKRVPEDSEKLYINRSNTLPQGAPQNSGNFDDPNAIYGGSKRRGGGAMGSQATKPQDTLLDSRDAFLPDFRIHKQILVSKFQRYAGTSSMSRTSDKFPPIRMIPGHVQIP